MNLCLDSGDAGECSCDVQALNTKRGTCSRGNRCSDRLLKNAVDGRDGEACQGKTSCSTEDTINQQRSVFRFSNDISCNKVGDGNWPFCANPTYFIAIQKTHRGELEEGKGTQI